MDKQQLDQTLTKIVELRTSLGMIDYAHHSYDQLEEELHEVEDRFQELYGDYLETVLKDVHRGCCPDSEVLIPIAYLGNKYEKSNGSFLVPKGQGVHVHLQKDDQEGYLVLVPKPTRLLLEVEGEVKTVWEMD